MFALKFLNMPLRKVINGCKHYKSDSDVAELKHGHIIGPVEAAQIDRLDLEYCCSVCKKNNWDITESENFNYCPICGAKMNG